MRIEHIFLQSNMYVYTHAQVEKMSTIYQLILLCWTSQVIGVRSFTRFFFPEQRSLSLVERVEKSITFQWRRKHFEFGWANSKKETGKCQLQDFLYTWVCQKLGGPYPQTSYAPAFLKSDRAQSTLQVTAKLNISMKSWNSVPISCFNFLQWKIQRWIQVKFWNLLAFFLQQKLFLLKIWLTYSKWCRFPTIHEVNY